MPTTKEGTQKLGVVKKVLVKKDCTYVSALNKKNAILKFAKQARKLL